MELAAEPLARLERSPDRVTREEELQAAMLGPIRPRLLQQGPGAGQPPAAHGPIAEHVPVIQATVRAARPAAMVWRSRR